MPKRGRGLGLASAVVAALPALALGPLLAGGACGSDASEPSLPLVVLPPFDGGNDGGWLYTDSNVLRNADGSPFHGRGTNLQDTRSCNACTTQAPDVDEVIRRADTLIDGWHASFVRLTLESYASADGRTQWQTVLDDPAYLQDLVTLTQHFQARQVYVLVSLWSDPTLDAMGWPTAATSQEWQTLAQAFQPNPYVLYGVANEPQKNDDGSLDAQVWSAMNDVVQAIRDSEAAAGPNHVIAVQGTRGWARRLDYYTTHPITAGGGGNIVYEEHFYDPASLLTSQLVAPGKTLPVIVGEFGPATMIAIMTLADCAELMQTAEASGIPWLAYTFHFRCPPNLLLDETDGGCGIGAPLVPSGDYGALVQARLSNPW